MTFKLHFGIDPGVSGAVAVLADSELVAVHDMPLQQRIIGKGEQVNGSQLASMLRGYRMQHSGAACLAVLEKVGGFRGQGGASMFNFGQADGIVRGVLAALGIEVCEPTPRVWKQHFHIHREAKDVARMLAIRLFPARQQLFARAKDIGRADAALVGLWAHSTEAEPTAPLPAPLFLHPTLHEEKA